MTVALADAPATRFSISVTTRQALLLRHAASTTPGVSAISEVVRRALDTYFEQQNISDAHS